MCYDAVLQRVMADLNEIPRGAELAMRENMRCAFNELVQAGVGLESAYQLMQAELDWRFSACGRAMALMPTPKAGDLDGIEQ